jgi:DNA-directed RNA polymerase subunit N
MMIPVRCWSCGKPIAHLWEQYKNRTNAGEKPKEVMDDLGLERYCCRAIFVGHVELVESAGSFKKS